jgi:chromosome segregation ATPase
MDNAEGGGGLAPLTSVQQRLLSDLDKLTDKRKNLEAELKALEKQLKKVDVEVEATRRMLGLVEATEKQLAAQGQDSLHEIGQVPVETGTKVRGRFAARSAFWHDTCVLCRNSPRQQLLANEPGKLRRRSRRSLSPRGPFLWPFARTTCCLC